MLHMTLLEVMKLINYPLLLSMVSTRWKVHLIKAKPEIMSGISGRLR